MMMRSLILFTLSSVICVAYSAPNLLAYSTNAHFLCHLTTTNACDQPHPSTLSTQDIAPLLHHLTSSADSSLSDSTSSSSLLPLAKPTDVSPPELVLLVHSVPLTDFSLLLRKLFDVAPSERASSFHAATRDFVTLSHVDRLVSRILPSVDDFAAVVADDAEPIFDNEQADLIALPVDTADQLPTFIHALRAAAARSKNNVAVVFAFRQGNEAAADAPPPAADPAPEGEQQNTEADTESNANTGDNADAGDRGDEGALSDGKTMNPPNVTADQLAALFVGFMFLLIFIPGFLCLWRIQTPQTFAILDSNDMKKKLQ